MEICGEEEGWDAPCGLPDVLDLDQLVTVTKARSDDILEEKGEEEITLNKPYLPPIGTGADPISVFAPRPLASSPTPSLPPLLLARDAPPPTLTVPSILWSQDHSSLSLQISLPSPQDLSPDHLHLTLRGRLLQLRVLQPQAGHLSLLSTPPLTLWGEVQVTTPRVQIHGACLAVRLVKTRHVFWPQLGVERLGWVRPDPQACPGSSSDEEPEEEKPVTGFLAPFLGSREGKHYHPQTGEEVLGEAVFSGEEEDEVSEEDFIHERVLRVAD